MPSGRRVFRINTLPPSGKNQNRVRNNRQIPFRFSAQHGQVLRRPAYRRSSGVNVLANLWPYRGRHDDERSAF